MIASYQDKETERLADGKRVKKFEAIAVAARRKLAMLDAATSLADLAAVPGNHLEVLGGNRKNQHSIRLNDQYRICFEWKDNQAHAVEITDYH